MHPKPKPTQVPNQAQPHEDSVPSPVPYPQALRIGSRIRIRRKEKRYTHPGEPKPHMKPHLNFFLFSSDSRAELGAPCTARKLLFTSRRCREVQSAKRAAFLWPWSAEREGNSQPPRPAVSLAPPQIWGQRRKPPNSIPLLLLSLTHSLTHSKTHDSGLARSSSVPGACPSCRPRARAPRAACRRPARSPRRAPAARPARRSC